MRVGELARRLAPQASEWLSQLRYRSTRPRFFGETGEDAVLRAAFGPNEVGSYVDVGAGHPLVGNNSYWAYRRGWAGIAVDPGANLPKLWARARPRDRFLPQAAGPFRGQTSFYEMRNSLLSTTSLSVSEMHAAEGRAVKVRPVEQVPLGDILPSHLDASDPFFLSVDVEGGEEGVLSGVDFSAQRPRIIAAESWTAPWMSGVSLSRFLRDVDYELFAYTGLTGFWSAVEIVLPGQAQRRALGSVIR